MPKNPGAAIKKHAGAIEKLQENIRNHEKALRKARLEKNKQKKGKS